MHNNQSIVGLCVQHLGFLYRRCLTSLKKRVSGKSLKKIKGRKKKELAKTLKFAPQRLGLGWVKASVTSSWSKF